MIGCESFSDPRGVIISRLLYLLVAVLRIAPRTISGMYLLYSYLNLDIFVDLSVFSLSPAMVLTDNFPCMILHRRNLACIGCGCPRPLNRTPSPHHQSSSSGMQPNRLPSSPRFVAPSTGPFAPTHSPTYPQFAQSSPFPQGHLPQSPSTAKSPSPAHHLLTPSGRAFAVGGKVQNISTDPLSPCVMYWPDNEPFPEQGQIRPSVVMGVPVRRISRPSVF